jgi:Acetyl-CoA hydrolase/transferase C-terminal domain
MFVDGFLDLYRSGILKRRVYSDARVQRLLDAGVIGERVDDTLLAALADNGLTGSLSAADFASLQASGVFRAECWYRDGNIIGTDGPAVAARLDTSAARAALLQRHTGRQLMNGVLLHAGFFMGPRGFYAGLGGLPESERRQFAMDGVAFINQLGGAEHDLKLAQRRDARFINTTMMVTLLGAAVSDALADGRVVSGVGGQYNFVAMAHSLPGARSILALRSTRDKDGKVTSNLLWNYAHTTIPRHLRDIVITEYGIADLRGRTDQEIIAALLNIADSRFQVGLKQEAQRAGKLAPSYEIPPLYRNNTPRSLQEGFALARARGLFSEYPFGTDFTSEEIVLAKALQRIKSSTRDLWPKVRTIAAASLHRDTPAAVRPYLERMRLDRTESREEWIWQRLLVRELKALL